MQEDYMENDDESDNIPDPEEKEQYSLDELTPEYHPRNNDEADAQDKDPLKI